MPGPGVSGAPGIRLVAPEPVRALTGVRRDVAAFVGVAARGPARLPAGRLDADVPVGSWLASAPVARSLPVAVTSWDEYRRLFGGFEGPGRLPYAVSAFFAGGGQRAYVVRIVASPSSGDPSEGCARGALLGLTTASGRPITLRARNEGSWGNRLQATLRFRTRPVALLAGSDVGTLVVDRDEWVPVGSLLRVDIGAEEAELRFVADSRLVARPVGAGVDRHLRLASPLADPGAVGSALVEVVTADLEVTDLDPTFARRETVADVGLSPKHPRWLARALAAESELVLPLLPWADERLAAVDPRLAAVVCPRMSGGVDLWQRTTPADFFDRGWVPGDEAAGSGVQCLADLDDVGLLVAADLYQPAPLSPRDDVRDPIGTCGPDFGEHVDAGPPPPPPEPPPPGLDGLALDPLDAADRAEIVARQQELVDFAEQARELTVLLDVPPGLSPRQVLEWRNGFDSPYAAAYHPWLDVSAPDDGRDSLVRVNPSAFAAGIVAERELRLGVHHGPANQVAVGAVRVAERVSTSQHEQLHPAGINVFVDGRDGIRLSGARTLARRRSLRQLSVARLMTVLRLTLQREMAWAVFEPNDETLWNGTRRMIHALLTRLYEAGAFEGATSRDAFFVRADRSTMSRYDLDNGRFVCLVGVAAAEPVEYLVLEIARERDTSVSVELSGSAAAT